MTSTADPGPGRLSAATRPDLLPPYDRTPPPRIVHLGVGAFARAHLGAYADDLLRAGWPATIRGISLRTPTAEQQLMPQDGLYSVLEREPGGPAPPRVLGAITVVATGAEAAVAAIAGGNPALVTLTVTEKAYAGDEVPTLLARALAERDPAAPAPIVASLDNVAGNGARLRARVLEAADRVAGDRSGWIAAAVRFPDSVVDRMVPATTAADREEVERALGCRDEAATVAEHHRSWVLEDVAGLPPLADVGVEVVGDVEPYQRRKLWLLNGPHSALAYGGLLAGCETIAEAAAHPVVTAFVRALVDDVLDVVDVPDARAYADQALGRFANPALGHTCRQVGADGSEKLRQRLLPVVERREQRGRSTARLAVVAALWQASVTGTPLRGKRLPRVDDPGPTRLPASPAFTGEVAGTLERLMRDGVDVLRDAP